MEFLFCFFFFFNDTATTEIYTLSLHDALPTWARRWPGGGLLHSAASPAPEQTPYHPRCGESRDKRGQRDNDIHQRIADGPEHGVPVPDLDIADRSGRGATAPALRDLGLLASRAGAEAEANPGHRDDRDARARHRLPEDGRHRCSASQLLQPDARGGWAPARQAIWPANPDSRLSSPAGVTVTSVMQARPPGRAPGRTPRRGLAGEGFTARIRRTRRRRRCHGTATVRASPTLKR